MSMGFGGWCYMEAQDDNTIIYKYGSYNLNDAIYSNKEQVCDGMIVIDKSSLVEPDIHKKIKRFPNGKKKLIIKRIVVDVPYLELFENGKIQIQNSNNCWKSDDYEKDFIAWKLIRKIFTEYQEQGEISEQLTFNV